MVTTKQQLENRQKRRLDEFNQSLSAVYRNFDKSRYPRPDLAEKLFKEWQNFDDLSDFEVEQMSNGTLKPSSPFLNWDCPGLILFGSPRSGKTQLACELARQKITTGFADARFISACQWAAETTAKAKRCELDDWTNQNVKFAYSREVDPGIIILDDLDKIRVSPSVQSQLFNFIEEITANKLYLIVTTNVSSRELAGKFAPEFGSAIVARLQEFCAPVDFNKFSTRKQAADGVPIRSTKNKESLSVNDGS
jgi:DNA replication protein DnaC